MNLPPVFTFQWTNASGPLSGGMLYSYAAGTSTPLPTYTDQTGGTPNTNPVVLDSNGSAPVWLDPTLSYKFVLTDASSNTIFTRDNVVGTLTANAVGTASIQNGSVTTAKLAANAVTSAILASDPAIDANRAVGTNAIQDGSITSGKLGASTAASSLLRNTALAATVASNNLTIALKTQAGNDPAATDVVAVGFRNPTATIGTYNVRSITSALSIVVPSATTLGTVSGATETIYVYLIDNAGVPELAVSAGALIDEGSLITTTAVSSGANKGTVYSTTSRTSVPIRLIGRLTISEVTAGTWATAPTEISIVPFINGPRSQVRVNTHSAYGSTNTKIAIFANVVDNYGSGITYATSATLGDTFTINETALYGISFTMSGSTSSGGGGPGISLNSSQLTTNVISINVADRLAATIFSGASSNSVIPGSCSYTGVLKKNDVIRAHTQGLAPDVNAYSNFTIVQLSR